MCDASITIKKCSVKVLITMTSGLIGELFDEVEAAGEYDEGIYSGSGIVICAGGSIMLANAYVLVRVLRDIHQTALPIEIWHLGPAEMPAFLTNIFARMGCKTVDALSVGSSKVSEFVDGWQLKALALKHSSFEEVILLDADQVPLGNPAAILDWREYAETGAVFWPDIVHIAAENPVWQLLGLTPVQVQSWESGQLCINKKLHWRAVNLVLAINERAETFYQLVYGDKDTFLLAWQLTKSSFSLVPHPPFQGQKYLVQRDFSGKPLFQHRTNCKWSLTEANEDLDGFELFAECQVFLDELAQMWNGVVFHAPPQSVEAQLLERELIEQRRFTATHDDLRSFEVELLPGNQIGKGRSFELTNWYIGQQDDEPVLVLKGWSEIRAPLSRRATGKWLFKGDDRGKIEFCLDPLREGGGPPDSMEGPIDIVTDLIGVAGKQLSELNTSLELLARTNPAIIRQIETAAAFHEKIDAVLAGNLASLAAKLRSAEEKPAKSVRHLIMGDKNLYVRP
ncbi:hypothetical protein [Anderseniella sp. Alg231-50]|uniref:hypothetical protein n=1 Tax=Anderseniella sp. Alg231-50 TaxID=1922226 RepID=UPI00307C530B